MMEAEFLDLMPHTVALEEILERDTYGKPAVYGAVTAVRAYVNVGRKRFVTATGQEVVARGVAYCAGPTIPASDSVISVPAALGFPQRMSVLAVTARPDETGTVHHAEVAF